MARRVRAELALLLCGALTACDRLRSGRGSGADANAADADVAFANPAAGRDHGDASEEDRDPAGVPAWRRAGTAAAPPVGVRRVRVTSAHEARVLAPFQTVVDAHFGGSRPPLLVQEIDLTRKGAKAVLVTDATKAHADAAPFLLVSDPADAGGDARWVKENPVAGIVRPVGAVALAAGPNGRVALGICDPPTRRVALRIWDEDGSPFSDFDAMDTEDCSELSVLYWSSHGWLLVASRPSETRGQLVTEHGRLAWGRGVPLGARSASGAAAALAALTDDSFMLVQSGSARDRESEHLYAYRYDAKGAAMFRDPVDLGGFRRGAPRDPVSLTLRPGAVRVQHPEAGEVEVSHRGELTPRRGLQ